MTFNANFHPDSEVLERYSLGHLSGGELDGVEDHLLTCEDCQDELALVDSYITDIKAGCRAARQTEPKGVGWWERLVHMPVPAMAGALAALLLVVLLPLAHNPSTMVAPATVHLSTDRGAPATESAQAEAKRPLHLDLRLASVPAGSSHRVEVVNAKGARVWSGTASGHGTELSVDTDASLGPGLYWVRLYDPGNRQLNEYRLELK